jgi:tRNA pseudouridine55 synthase
MNQPHARSAPRKQQHHKPKANKNILNGWVNLDKPYDMTSTQAVGAVKRIMKPAKIGHAGTLDPLATGILPLALGEATKTVQYLMDSRKEYRFTVAFGTQTTTDDAEGEVIKESDVRPDTDAILAALPNYLGNIEQIPPIFSAIKIAGERAYDLARAGEIPEMKPRPVMIYRFELESRPDADHAVFYVECGKGTYVRALARDIALALGSCGHISALRRTRVGSFTEADAISLDELEKYATEIGQPSPEGWLHSVKRALDDIPAVTLDQSQAQSLRHGQSCLVSPAYIQVIEDELVPPPVYKALYAGKIVALVSREGRSIAPVRIFNL